MAVLVDTNIIMDVLTDDPVWADWSIAQLAAHGESGLIINPLEKTGLVEKGHALPSARLGRDAICV